MFNEEEVFDGNLDHLKDDVREGDAEELGNQLQHICTSETEPQEPQADPATG